MYVSSSTLAPVRVSAHLGIRVAALVGALAFASGAARAGNADSQLIGNQGALSGNAVTAIVSDAGATWHNPAGLAFIERGSVNLTATAIGFRSYVMRNSLEVALPDSSRSYDLRHTEVVASPSAIVVVRKLSPDATGALGLFLKAQGAPQQVWAQADSAATGPVPSGGSYNYAQRFSVQQKGHAIHLGPALGIRLSPDFNVGASLFVVYEQARAFSELFSDLSSSDPVAGPRSALMSQYSRSSSTLSGQGVLGAQWKLDRDWQVGAVLRTPIMLLLYSFHSESLNSSTVDGGWLQPVATSKDASSGLLLSSLAPPRLHLGIARLFSWGWISLEGNISPPKGATDFLQEQKLVWNVRLGVRRDLSETVSVGAGFFTDRTPGRSVDRFAEGRLDYYGASAGMELRKPFMLREGGDDSKLIVSTTFALRYGLGRGNAARVVLDTVSNSVVDSPPGKATVNEVDLYIGSGLSF
jgi:long-subunit fatty acid transport protein